MLSIRIWLDDRRIVSVRKFRLMAMDLAWLTDADRARLGEGLNKVTRFDESMALARHRGRALHEDVTLTINERTGHILYVVALVSAVFLPLTLVSDLLGMNVGGIPWAESDSGFINVGAALAAIAVGIVVWFKTKKWL